MWSRNWLRVLRPHPGPRYRFRPGRWCVGELESVRGREFAALRSRGPVLVVTTLGRGVPYARLAVSTFHSEGDSARLRQPSLRTGKKVESEVVK